MSDIQRHGSTENQRLGDSEKRSIGDAEETEVTDAVPRLAASVGTLQDAVRLSLQHGINEKCLFIFARALKAFEITTHCRLSPAGLDQAFSLWWSTAKPQLPDDADYDQYRLEFLARFDAAKAALGSNSLEEAVRLARAGELPPQAVRYTGPKIRLLIAVCYRLQVLQGTSPFFLSARDAAKATGAKSHWEAAAWLRGLVRDGVLIEVKKGTRGRATRFRFNAPEFVCLGFDQAEAASADEPRVRARNAGSTPAAPKQLSTYDLVERKKAIHELLKEFGDPRDSQNWSEDDRKQYKRLKAELKDCNQKLSDLGS